MAPDSTLSNQPACITLELYGQEIDRLCYPQAQEGTKYYHTRHNRGPEIIPDEFIQALMDREGNLSKLILRRVDTKICMVYDGVQIRCMNAPNTRTSDRNRALLTLSNAYISMITDLAYGRNLNSEDMVVLRRSYNVLRQRIQNNQLGEFEVYGARIRPTELERYIELTYHIPPDEYIVDVFSRTLL